MGGQCDVCLRQFQSESSDRASTIDSNVRLLSISMAPNTQLPICGPTSAWCYSSIQSTSAASNAGRSCTRAAQPVATHHA